jgi:hypothetical protein
MQINIKDCDVGVRLLINIRPMADPVEVIVSEFSDSNCYVRFDISGVSRWVHTSTIQIVDTLKSKFEPLN